ncbi:unnamed protein product, partial [Meganyctiphanes norvegica]
PVPPPAHTELELKVYIVEQNVMEIMQFDPATLVYKACEIIREKIPEANQGRAQDYGLFLGEDEGDGIWLDSGRNLRYYMLMKNDMIQYRSILRSLKVSMLDGVVQTLMVDDSQLVEQLMVDICNQIGILNYTEYSLVSEVVKEKQVAKVDTLNRRHSSIFTFLKKNVEEQERDDEINWVEHSQTLREQGIDEREVLLLRRKYFSTDLNIDHRDPVQLNLLYLQCRDAILDGTHSVTEKECIKFAGIQCQIQFGHHVDQKHKSGFM